MPPSRRLEGPRRRSLGLAAAISTLLLTAPLGAGARDPLYQWSDGSGTVRYTTHRERIPEAHRDGARIVEPTRGAPELPTAPPASDPEAAEDSSAGPPQPPVEAAPAETGEAQRLEARIAQLEAAIARDESTLKEMVSDPEGGTRLRESGDLATIAERMPRLQQELRELRAEREALAGSDAP